MSTTKEKLSSVTIRFCGDSGDGMQLTGNQFTTTSALFGNDIATYPNFPAEIRAPLGTLAGVSGFQVRFASNNIFTAGDELDALVAMNPAAMKTNLEDLKQNGILIINEDSFTDSNLSKAGFNPEEDILETYRSKYRVYEVPITKMTLEALKDSPIPSKLKERSKNMFALGLMYFLYNRSLEPTIEWLEGKFGSKPDVLEANINVMKAGYNFGDTCEMIQSTYEVPKAKIKPGKYRNITGNEALSIGFVAASKLSNKSLFLGSYPITPATEILQELAKYKHFGVKTFQAEDEIAGIGSAIGASFAGQLALTTTSGPGIALKSEFMNLAMITELPLVIVDVMRGGPSTGLPTKTEQTDLLQVLYGRNGESPIPVLAAKSPSDCFDTAIEACRIALEYMTPVVILSETQIAIGSEPWLLPNIEDLAKIKTQSHTDPDTFQPYNRNKNLARPWAIPGTPGCEHTLGGLEKSNITGKVNLSAEVHEEMTRIRAQKVANIAKHLPATERYGETKGDLLLLGWGSTYGSNRSAVEELLARGYKVAQAHIKHINPLPNDLESILRNYKHVMLPELNSGQLNMILRAKFLIDIKAVNQINTKPFNQSDLVRIAEEIIEGKR
ncbi:MAG: 2-oxoacid:acceptor oxidoreductase subunit alpha [Cyanobacteria bacterium]|nr:2-oxoacid:acceptor oxidoreductase subunit alpha [Cyanobacteriota bacterium]MDA1020059.1 2-oxoacid:acceptor oxidoreductase subunit alpha [Cyanobacteriota bacterium]